jgi:DnaJ family protein C protein 28
MDLGRLIEKKLQEAREAGAFDALPRKGQLDLGEEDGTPEAERLAMHLLKSNGFAPAWIEDDKALRDKLFGARSGLYRAHLRRQRVLKSAEEAADRMRAEEEWKAARARFEKSIEEINRDIFHFNLRAPSIAVHRMPLRVSEEYERLDKEVIGNR